MSIILASESPRRRELLSRMGLDFIVRTAPHDETMNPFAVPSDEVARVSLLKAQAVYPTCRGEDIIVAADTIVVCDGLMMGKPRSEADAFSMLRRLSGHTHTVVTGVTLADRHHSRSFAEQTKVKFDHLTHDEINTYVETFHPFDKAGSYGIQEWIGCIGIRGIEGDFYNVMGLPLHALYREIKAFPL